MDIDRAAPGADYAFVNSTGPGLGTYSNYGGGYEVTIQYTIEPDADHDGYGDETQDLCPTDATTHGPCPATGRRAAALKKCKKKHSHKKRKKCKKKANKLPV